MRLTRRLIINTIAFLVLSALLIFILAIQVLPSVFRSTYPVYAIFPSAGGVATNQEVTYRGVQVGHIGHMTLTNDAVKIEMVIDASFKIPKDGTRAQVLFKSAVGEQFIDLQPARDDGPIFHGDEVIPKELTSIPVQIEDLLRELVFVLRSIDPKELGSVIHELGTGLTGHGRDLRSLILSLDELSRIGASHQEQIAALLADGADLQDAFNSNRQEFVDAVDSLRTVLDTVAARTKNVRNTLSSAKTFDADLIHLLDKRGEQLNDIVADLGTTVRVAHMHQEDLDRLLTYLGPFFADVSKAYYAPYFVFNLVANPEPLNCTYDPSSRPVRQVTNVSPTDPETNFECSGSSASVQASASTIRPLSPAAEVALQRVSWVRLYTLGY